jgi:hypothetical protein
VIEFKPGVLFGPGVTPAILRAMASAGEIFAKEGRPLVVTSVRDGKHMKDSLHYHGAAFDCRSKHLPDYETKLRVLGALEAILGRDYDVILERRGDPSEHFHIEYDPKGA